MMPSSCLTISGVAFSMLHHSFSQPCHPGFDPQYMILQLYQSSYTPFMFSICNRFSNMSTTTHRTSFIQVYITIKLYMLPPALSNLLTTQKNSHLIELILYCRSCRKKYHYIDRIPIYRWSICLTVRLRKFSIFIAIWRYKTLWSKLLFCQQYITLTNNLHSLTPIAQQHRNTSRFVTVFI